MHMEPQVITKHDDGAGDNNGNIKTVCNWTEYDSRVHVNPYC